MPVCSAAAAAACQTERPPARLRPNRQARAALLLLLPSLLLLLAFTYWPLVEVGWRSLDQGRPGQAAQLGLGNYLRMFADPHFARAAENNAVYAVGTAAPSVMLALLFALALQAGTRLDLVLRTLVVLPQLIPLVAAAALFSFILLPGEGLLDHYLAKLGVGATNWLGDASLALGAIIAITVWKNTGYYMLFFLAGLAAVPGDLLDAARVDGARAWGRLRFITLPLLGPTFGFVVPVALLNALTQVDHVVLMTQGGPSDATNLLLYYIYQQAGLDPDHPPATWAEWAEDARKLTKRDGGNTTRYGLMMVSSYDTLGWLLSGLAMSNGGQYYDQAWGGEVYYNEPSVLGAVRFLDTLVHTDHSMPEGVTDPNTVAAAFFSGRAAMIVNSTGALGFVRDGMKQPYKVAFIPRAIRHAVPIGGGSLMIPTGNSPERQRAAWLFINDMTSPAVAGGWSRFTGYFAPNRHAYELPEMQGYLAEHPDAKVALDQLQYAQPWFATYATVAVRKAMEDQVQAVLSGRTKPAEAVANAQKAADELLRPYAERTALQAPK